MRRREMNRREMTKATLAGLGGATLAQSATTARGADKRDVPLSLAGYAYDRVRAIQDGRVKLDGVEHEFLVDNIYSLNKHVFGSVHKYDVSETGLIPYVCQFANNNFRDYTLIPVFVSRVFRHRNIFVPTDGSIKRPEDLRGKRIATPGYGMSATTWIRGFLQDIHGVKPDDMQWIETTKSSDGGALNSGQGLDRYFLPKDFPLTKGPAGVDESDMLEQGRVDAIISAITPKAFKEGKPGVRRLFEDSRAAEQDYFRRTRVFPIMHAVAVRRELADARPELLPQLVSLYERAKALAYEDLEISGVLKTTLPWATHEFEETRKLMGDDYWPYGIKANRKELELVMRYVAEQGLAKRRVRVEEIFHPSTLEL